MKEKGQYAVAFGLVGVMLYAVGFPIFFLLFVGALTYFIWKVFSSESRSDVRRIFEFYLSANEILRDDHRHWYGFEIQETINLGERLVRSMSYSPPLVHFALGALYERLGDNSSAVKHLSYLAEGKASEEGIVFPSNELREYVRILRKIERSPAEAPQTSSAIRSLERSRKSKTAEILSRCQLRLAEDQELHGSLEPLPRSIAETSESKGTEKRTVSESNVHRRSVVSNDRALEDDHDGQAPSAKDRKTISEVLHDIYDGSVQ
jgi:hypothetical protein